MSKNPRLSKTVLVVDDLEMLRKMVSDFLKSLGIDVLEASSAAEAIQIVRSHPGTIDLLLTDLEMPGMSGWELAKTIAVLKPGIRIVYMSAGMTKVEWRESQGVQSGSFFLQKPFRVDELKTLISTILARP